MKQFIYCGLLLLILGSSCHNTNTPVALRDGFYEVIARDSAASRMNLSGNQLLVPFDNQFEPSEGPLVIDTSDFVPLEPEAQPTLEPFGDHTTQLSVALSPDAASKIHQFTASRVMRQVAIVMDGKAITVHKIREAISGPRLQITRCSDDGCHYLFVKMKEKLK